MTFTLYLCVSTGRHIIAPTGAPTEDTWLDLKEVEANSWVEAKAAFAQPLTPLQEELAPLSTAEREAVLQREAWLGFGNAIFGAADPEEKQRPEVRGWVHGH